MEALAAVGVSFERQFWQKERFVSPYGQVSVIDVKPETVTDQIPILIAPGWSEDYQTYRKTLKTAFNSSRRALSLEYSRLSGSVIGNEGYPEVELRKARLILDMLKKKGIDRADVIAHSEGAINVLIAAMLKPEQFRNIVLDKPAGLVGKDTRSTLTGRFIRMLLEETIIRPPLFMDPASSVSICERITLYALVNPASITKEMDAITTFEIKDLMEALQNRGVMLSVISGVHDPLFPVSKQIGYMRETGVPSMKGYYSVVGGHNELSIHANKHATLAINALDGLQRLRSSR
ncbi:MAG: alpha/beta hydrolase [Candidatus Levybacteria bacterium]|nr:alpha/beta hydrolase [Candidatus Levybacteria bacterium]